MHLNVLSLNSHSSQSRGWHKTVSGCRCSSWTSQPLEKPLTEKAPPLQAIVQIMRPFFCPLSFTPNVYNWSHQIFLHLPQMLLGVNALSIERFSVLRIRAKKLENPKVQPKSKIPCWGLLRGSRVSGESRVITALRICCGKEEEGGKTSVTAFASFGKNQDRWTSSPLELNQCSRKTNNCWGEINPKKHFDNKKNLMITPSLKSSLDKWKMSSSWNSCCHFDRVDNIWCKLRIGTCLRV